MVAVGFKEAKRSFLRTQEIFDGMDKATAKVMNTFGAKTTRKARQSIRRRKKVSDPGKPPSAHGGQIKLIFYAYDGKRRSVVSGPVLFKPRRGQPGAGALEKGGVVLRKRSDGKAVLVRLRKRPFMQPAFESELKNEPAKLYKDSLK